MNEAFEWPRIHHLLKLGIMASLVVLTGDMLLGWDVSDTSLAEIPAIFT